MKGRKGERIEEKTDERREEVKEGCTKESRERETTELR